MLPHMPPHDPDPVDGRFVKNDGHGTRREFLLYE